LIREAAWKLIGMTAGRVVPFSYTLMSHLTTEVIQLAKAVKAVKDADFVVDTTTDNLKVEKNFSKSLTF
jgi:uncharacterized membrane protein